MTRMRLPNLLTGLGLWAVLLSCGSVNAGGNDTDDSNRCLWLLSSGKSITRFSSMPGGGWDNLRNKDMGLVADLSFADCTLSDDGMYVLPRNVILYARKESAVEVMSELMEHYGNYTSSVSVSINVGTGGALDLLGIGGKLSNEYEQVKSVAVENKLGIGRSQLRYRLYSAKLQPDFKLSKALKDRLTDILNALVNNQTKTARYLSDLVVRDFGTHVITSVEAGGILEKLDFFTINAVTDRDFMQNKFSASMSVSFHKLIGVDIGGGTTVTKEDINKYQTTVKKTSVRSYGGSILGPTPKLQEWMKTLKENLVPVDREGEPLYGIISRGSMPGVPLTYMMLLRKTVEDAVLRYYKANTVKGCQDPNSPSFDPIANVAGHCDSPVTNFSFAGVFQTCEETNPAANLNLCGPEGGEQKHPITGEFTCPTGYEARELVSMTGRHGRRCWEKKRRCWLFFTCDDGQECVESITTLRAFWCAARREAKLQQQSGMVFGGAFANDGRFVNEITQTKSCSEFYKPYLIGRDIQVCLSMDLQSAARYRIPFAGFFSCKSGNPLADPTRGLVTAAASSDASASTDSPKRCPDGFSQVTLDTIDGCAVMQCVKSRSGLRRLPVRRPPFEQPEYEVVDRPVVRVESHGWRWGYNFSTHTWSFLGFFGASSAGSSVIGASSPIEAQQQQQQQQQRAPSSTSGASPAILAVIGCLAGVALVAMVVCIARKRGGGGTGPGIRRTLRGLRSWRANTSGRRGRHRNPYVEVTPPEDESRQPIVEDGEGQANSYGSLEADEVVCDNEDDTVVQMEDGDVANVQVVHHRVQGTDAQQ